MLKPALIKLIKNTFVVSSNVPSTRENKTHKIEIEHITGSKLEITLEGGCIEFAGQKYDYLAINDDHSTTPTDATFENLAAAITAALYSSAAAISKLLHLEGTDDQIELINDYLAAGRHKLANPAVFCVVCHGEIEPVTDSFIPSFPLWMKGQNICGQDCFDRLSHNGSKWSCEAADQYSEYSTLDCSNCDNALEGSRHIRTQYVADDKGKLIGVFCDLLCLDCRDELLVSD